MKPELWFILFAFVLVFACGAFAGWYWASKKQRNYDVTELAVSQALDIFNEICLHWSRNAIKHQFHGAYILRVVPENIQFDGACVHLSSVTIEVKDGTGKKVFRFIPRNGNDDTKRGHWPQFEERHSPGDNASTAT